MKLRWEYHRETNPIVTMGPSGPMGRPALTPAEHEINLTMKTTRVNCLWTTLPLRKPITSGTPELLADMHINCNGISTHHFSTALSY